MDASEQRWFEVANAAEVPSPALLVYPERVAENIQAAINIIHDVDRLRPHVKTHKLPEVVRMHLERGVTKFKCATVAEAEMCARAGAPDLLLAYQPVGPNIPRVRSLVLAFPQTSFGVVADDAAIITSLGETFGPTGASLSVFLDINCGMDRTGVAPDDRAIALYRQITDARGLKAGGLHAYDGHIHDTDPDRRAAAAHSALEPVLALRQRLTQAGLDVPTVVAGGTPTFPVHARRGDVECSPGTYVFWDFGYAETMPDLPFRIAAVLMTRVVSKPGGNRLCLDLGHKAVAAEQPAPRVKLLSAPDAQAVMHSEEHLVIETAQAAQFPVGQALYALPRHICPTVALHQEVVVVRNGRAEARWKVVARDRSLTF